MISALLFVGSSVVLQTVAILWAQPATGGFSYLVVLSVPVPVFLVDPLPFPLPVLPAVLDFSLVPAFLVADAFVVVAMSFALVAVFLVVVLGFPLLVPEDAPLPFPVFEWFSVLPLGFPLVVPSDVSLSFPLFVFIIVLISMRI